MTAKVARPEVEPAVAPARPNDRRRNAFGAHMTSIPKGCYSALAAVGLSFDVDAKAAKLVGCHGHASA
jgi:hypothetical protein